MAVGDTVSDISSVNGGDYLALQPAGTAEWIIQNIYFAGAIEIHQYDGANDITFDSDAAAGRRGRESFRCTNAIYIRVKNSTGGAFLIGYDGVITHV
jgi:hypothetical protein